MTLATGYWWIGKPNFGDLLTPLLLERFSKTRVNWAPVKDASFVCVGSILDVLPQKWTGIVIGSGKLRETSNVDLSSATVLALRGHLTANGVKARGDYVLGDPGLLADELVTDVEKIHDLGIIPHWSDIKLEHRHEFKQFKPVIIRPSSDPLEVIRQIGQCRKIVSSSLHGIIVADAFGIPRRTEMAESFSKEGGSFKFRDHSTTVGLEFKIGVTQEVPRSRIQDLQHELYDMFIELEYKLKVNK